MKYTIRPISDRAAFAGGREASRFTVSWSSALELLGRELDMLNASGVVFEVDVLEGQIRLDGMLRADARASSGAFRIAFDSKHGPLTYATARFVKQPWQRKGMQQDWQHNAYAIALSLEALRKVDRYGVTKRGEQYAGWKAIGAGGIALDGAMTKPEAVAVLHDVAGFGGRFTDLNIPYKKARANSHPDRHGGDRTEWDQVERAAKVLGLLEGSRG